MFRLFTPRRAAVKRARRALRLEFLETRETPATDLFVVPGAGAESVTLSFNRAASDAVFNNEVGVYAVQDDAGRVNGLLPTDAGYAAAALNSAQTLFGGGSGAASKQLSFAAGTRLAFYLVSNGTSAGVKAVNPQNQFGVGPIANFSVDGANPDGFDHFTARGLADGAVEFAVEDQIGGGDQDFNDVAFSVNPVPAATATGLIAIPGQAGQTVPTFFQVVSRDSEAANEVGVFVTDAADGRIGTVFPGDPGYAQAALNSATRQRLFYSFEGADHAINLQLPAGKFLGFFLVNGGTIEQAAAGGTSAPTVFFSVPQANPDGQPHMRLQAGGQFGFEDQRGGGDQDFNDFVGRFVFNAPVGTPGAAPNVAPTVKAGVGNQTVVKGSTLTLDLAGNFDDANLANSRVQLQTSKGPLNIELYDREAPRTVANFLNYLNSGRYDESIFHRRANSPNIIQGGGFTFEQDPTSRLARIPADNAVLNEPDAVNRPNIRGTLAMAKTSDPNSATSEFYFNVGNNSAALDATSNSGGFTVFGRVTDEASLAVLDALAAVPPQNKTNAAALPPTQKTVFGEIPLQNYSGTDFPTDTTAANYLMLNDVALLSQPEKLTYSVVGNTNPSRVNVEVKNNRLVVQGLEQGVTQITVRATDQSGAFVDNTFNLTVT